MSIEEQQQFLQDPFCVQQTGAYNTITLNINGVQKTMLVPSIPKSIVRIPQPNIQKTVFVRNSSSMTSPTATSVRPILTHSLSNRPLIDARLKPPGHVQVPQPGPCNTVRFVATNQSTYRNMTSILISRVQGPSLHPFPGAINRDHFSSNRQIIVMPPSTREQLQTETSVPLNQSGPHPTMLFGRTRPAAEIQTVLGLNIIRPNNTTSANGSTIPKQTIINVNQINSTVAPKLYKGNASALLQWFENGEQNVFVRKKVIEIAPDTDNTASQIGPEMLKQSQDTRCMTNVIGNNQITAEMQNARSVSDKQVDLPHFVITDARSVQPSTIRKSISETTPYIRTPIGSWDANLLDVLGIHDENSLEPIDWLQPSNSRIDTHADSETDTATSDVDVLCDPSESSNYSLMSEKVTNVAVPVKHRKRRRRRCAYSKDLRRKMVIKCKHAKRLNVNTDILVVDAQKVFTAKRTGGRPMLGRIMSSRLFGRSAPADSKLSNGCYAFVERVLMKSDSINIKRNIKNILCCYNGIINKKVLRDINSSGRSVKGIVCKKDIANNLITMKTENFAVAHCTDSTIRISNVQSLRGCMDSDEIFGHSDFKKESMECSYGESNCAWLIESASNVEKTNASSTLSSSPKRTVYVRTSAHPSSPVPMQVSASKLPPDLPKGSKFMLIKTTDSTYIMPMEINSRTVTSLATKSGGSSKCTASSGHIPVTLRPQVRQAPFQVRSLLTVPAPVVGLSTSVETNGVGHSNQLPCVSSPSGISEIISSKLIANQASANHEFVDLDSLNSDVSATTSVIGSISNASLKSSDGSYKPNSHRERINRLKEVMMRQEEQLDALRKQRLEV